jgi:hypothetical protein
VLLLLAAACGRSLVYEPSSAPMLAATGEERDGGFDAGVDAWADAGVDAGSAPCCPGLSFVLDCSGGTCRRICVAELTPQGCVGSGGLDDTLSVTNCCSNAAVPGSTCCNEPDDFGTTWLSCVQTCQ